MLHHLANLIPPAHGRTIGVGDAHVFAMLPHLLHGLVVTFYERVLCQVPLLQHSVEIIYGSHLEDTSIVGAPFPQGHYSVRASYAIHRSAWKGYSANFALQVFSEVVGCLAPPE